MSFAIVLNVVMVLRHIDAPWRVKAISICYAAFYMITMYVLNNILMLLVERGERPYPIYQDSVYPPVTFMWYLITTTVCYPLFQWFVCKVIRENLRAVGEKQLKYEFVYVSGITAVYTIFVILIEQSFGIFRRMYGKGVRPSSIL